MAIALDKSLGSNATGNLTTSAAAVSNSLITLLVGWFHATATLSSVAGGGLTWAIDKTVTNGSVRIALISAQAPAGLATSTTVTPTFSTSPSTYGVGAASFTGLLSSAALDGTASAAPANGTAWNCGGVVTTNANDVVVGVAMGDGAAGTSSTPSGSFLEVLDFNSGAGGDTYTLVYQIVAATGTYTPAGAWLTSQANVGVAAAYMAAGGGGGATVVKQLSALGVG